MSSSPPAAQAATVPRRGAGLPLIPKPVSQQSPVAEPPHITGAAPETGRISVDLAATEKTWVSLSSAGRTVFAGVLDASQTKNFALDEDAKLLTGNAAGLDVRMNGRAVGSFRTPWPDPSGTVYSGSVSDLVTTAKCELFTVTINPRSCSFSFILEFLRVGSCPYTATVGRLTLFEGQTRPVHVLLVEDNPGDVRLMREALRNGDATRRWMR